MKNLKKFIATILITILLVNFIGSVHIWSSDLPFDKLNSPNLDSKDNDLIAMAECCLAYNIFELLSYNTNKIELLNAFNELVKKNQQLQIEVTMHPEWRKHTMYYLWIKFTEYLEYILEEAGAPIDEINADDFIYREDNSLSFTFIFIINSYIKYIEDNKLSAPFDISEAKDLLKLLKEANDYFATHKQ